MRNTSITLLLVFATLFAAVAAGPATTEPAVDFQKARSIIEKFRRGQPVTPEERAYVERARQERARTNGQHRGGDSPATRPRESTGLVPLCDMKPGETYRGVDGGLYGSGRNDPPADLKARADAAARQIRPLDAAGHPDPAGEVVLMSIGMSNTTQEFSAFQDLAGRDADKSPNLVIVDAAQGGQDAEAWVNKPDVWSRADQRLGAAGVTPAQVQVVWIKQALAGPRQYGEFPDGHVARLRDDLLDILDKSHARYPNLRLAYLSSRIYAGYATTPLNPEPYAYEGAFAVRAAIQQHDKSDTGVVAVWGPYLWADGAKGRQSDSLVWIRDDVREDGTHPSASGRQKVARLLLDFFKSEPTARPWFVAAPDRAK